MPTAGYPVVSADVLDLPVAGPSMQVLTATATYALSDVGRAASLLAGGTGQTVQRVDVPVPVHRLHLVRVTGRGMAVLRLRPRFERTADERLVRLDALPTYDHLPSPDDLLRDAARNHQLEQTYEAERRARHASRVDAEAARRATLAAAFLAESSQRALRHPAPTPRRCVLPTPSGPVTFDRTVDTGITAEVPAEAFRRFRADLDAVRARRAVERAEHLHVHETRRTAMATWVAVHGTDDQCARHAAGLLPMAEVIEAMSDAAFLALAEYRQYVRDGAARMQVHVEQWTGQRVTVRPQDFTVAGRPATLATRAQWALLETFRAAVPGATVTLHRREYVWTRNPGVPRWTQPTIVVVVKVEPFTLRREYLVPEEDSRSVAVDGPSQVSTGG